MYIDIDYIQWDLNKSFVMNIKFSLLSLRGGKDFYIILFQTQIQISEIVSLLTLEFNILTSESILKEN